MRFHAQKMYCGLACVCGFQHLQFEPALKGENVSKSQAGGRGYSLDEVIRGVESKAKTISRNCRADCLHCISFCPVLCYRRTLDCWEMIRASGETLQDVERKDADRVNTHTYTPTHAHTHSQTHAHVAFMYALWYITSLHQSSRVCFTQDKIYLIHLCG